MDTGKPNARMSRLTICERQMPFQKRSKMAVTEGPVGVSLRRKSMLRNMLRMLSLAGVGSCLLLSPSLAQEDFYRGKSIKLVVGGSPTGGYNLNARTLARHMPKHIPGNPNIIVVNMPAGNGIAATNHLYNIADKDGTAFGLFNRYTVLLPVLGNEQARYKSEEFNW